MRGLSWFALAGAVLMLGTAGCGGARTRPPDLHAHASEKAALCFESSQGIAVYAKDGAPCPGKTAFARDAARVMARAGLPKNAFEGIRVVYVRGEIECGGIETLGCSDVDRRISLVSLDCPWPRKLTQHELGHQAIRASGKPDHVQNHGDVWWQRL